MRPALDNTQQKKLSESPSNQSEGIISALKEMQASFFGLTDAHAEHISQKIEQATKNFSKAAAAGYIIGPLLTAFILLGSLAIVGYVGFEEGAAFQSESMLQAAIVIVGLLLIATVGSVLIFKAKLDRATKELASIKTEFKRDLKMVKGRTHERSQQLN